MMCLQALKILTSVQSAFIANLDTLKWMDEATREKARSKAQAMGKVVGYPEWLLDPQKLDDYYEKVRFGSVFSIHKLLL